MRIPPRISAIGSIAALAATLLVGGPVAAAGAAPANHAPTASLTVAVKAVGNVCYSALPPQAHDTLDLIESGGPFPYDQDGTVFRNREGVLPGQSSGYYHEYTVITPGSPTRGARRIVTGQRVQEDYYTADHYASFRLVNHGC
ncbi:ribonuclease domain-containing protein [Streptomyces sp. NPDC050504]|uniref:ribonuclease domain-containing protein n=1 Tax=Streptomyces sp. NPDC050504 TaxID=3365618 RepID=UPI0037AACD5C